MGKHTKSGAQKCKERNKRAFHATAATCTSLSKYFKTMKPSATENGSSEIEDTSTTPDQTTRGPQPQSNPKIVMMSNQQPPFARKLGV